MSLINRAACKKAVLDIATSTRSVKFTRVGSDVLDHLEVLVLNHIKGIVHSHPSIGKTIMMGSKTRTNPSRAESGV